jgi:hypothetical protein
MCGQKKAREFALRKIYPKRKGKGNSLNRNNEETVEH